MSFLYRLTLFFAWLFFKIFYRHRVYGLEHYCAGGAILAANHTSFLDPPILAISWPEEVHFLARETLFRIPVFGAYIRALNAHPVSGDAGDIAVFKSIYALLKAGKKIILFPEGTRAKADRLGVIKPGIGLLITKTQTAIIPAYIQGAYSIWGRHRKFPKLWGKTACVFGSPIPYARVAHLEKKAAQQALADQLAAAIENLRAWYQEGAHGSPP